MSFDLHGAWEGFIGHSSPLYAANIDVAKLGYLTVVYKNKMNLYMNKNESIYE